ncbi:hypothetical protein [Enterococcus mundtii]|uniref:hypothetical protein n=2 Tax=Enterococcus TaxID=1350 RepID=UPI001E548977|nr:hypothetical protein [Enterococcus mundtii]
MNMHKLLGILNFGILGLMIISLISLVFFNNRMETFKQQIYSKKIISPALDKAELYNRIVRKSNIYILFGSVSSGISAFLLLKNILTISTLLLLLGIVFLFLSLNKWYYFKENISHGYLIIAKKKSYWIYYFNDQKEKDMILSWQNKMICSVYLTFFFYMLLLISTLLMKII